LTDFFQIEKFIRFTLNPEGNQIDFSDFSPWGWGIKSEKLVFLLKSVKGEPENKLCKKFMNIAEKHRSKTDEPFHISQKSFILE
jgi:hypothetical protein